MGEIWDCSGCWREFEMSPDAAHRRFELTTVYQPERVTDAFVCPNCGALLEPYLDGVRG